MMHYYALIGENEEIIGVESYSFPVPDKIEISRHSFETYLANNPPTQTPARDIFKELDELKADVQALKAKDGY